MKKIYKVNLRFDWDEPVHISYILAESYDEAREIANQVAQDLFSPDCFIDALWEANNVFIWTGIEKEFEEDDEVKAVGDYLGRIVLNE